MTVYYPDGNPNYSPVLDYLDDIFITLPSVTTNPVSGGGGGGSNTAAIVGAVAAAAVGLGVAAVEYGAGESTKK